MSDAGNRVIDNLTVAITDMLVATFGPSREATTDLNKDIEKYPAERTPLVFVERGPLRLSLDGYWQAEAKVALTGVIKPTAATAANLQAEVLKLEEMLFGLIGAGQLGGVQMEIAPDGDDVPSVGEKDALLVFPIVIKYARGA